MLLPDICSLYTHPTLAHISPHARSDRNYSNVIFLCLREKKETREMLVTQGYQEELENQDSMYDSI